MKMPKMLKKIFAVAAVTGAAGFGTNLALGPGEGVPYNTDDKKFEEELQGRLDELQMEALDAEFAGLHMDIALTFGYPMRDVAGAAENHYKQVTEFNDAKAEIGRMLYGDARVTPELFQKYYPQYNDIKISDMTTVNDFGTIREEGLVDVAGASEFLGQCRLQAGIDGGAYGPFYPVTEAQAESVRDCAVVNDLAQDVGTGLALGEGLIFGTLGASLLGAAGARRRRKEGGEEESLRESDRFKAQGADGALRKAPPPKGPAL